MGAARIAQGLLKTIRRCGDGLSLRQDDCAKLGQLIARRQTLHQPLAQLRLNVGQPALHGGLIDAQHLGRGKRAARLCDRQKKARIVPVEHRRPPRKSAAVCLRKTSVSFPQGEKITDPLQTPNIPGNRRPICVTATRRPAAARTGWQLAAKVV